MMRRTGEFLLVILAFGLFSAPLGLARTAYWQEERGADARGTGSGADRQGRSAAAIERAERALDDRNLPGARDAAREAFTALGEDPATDDASAELCWHIGGVAATAQDLSLARDAWSAVLSYERDVGRGEDPRALLAMGNVAVMMKQTGEAEGALVLEDELLVILRGRLDPEDPERVRARRNRALSLQSLGRIPEALSEMLAVLKIREAALDPLDPALLKTCLSVGSLYRHLNDLDAARSYFERAAEGFNASLGANHRSTMGALFNLAILNQETGDRRAARVVMERFLESVAEYPEDHPMVLAATQNLASIRSQMGDDLGAILLYEQVIRVRSGFSAPDDPSLVAVRGNLAASLSNLGRHAEAAEMERDTLDGFRERLAPGDIRIGIARANLAHSMKSLGRYEEARALQEEELRECESLLVVDDPRLAAAKRSLASTLCLQGDVLGASTLEEEAVEIVLSALPIGHPESRVTISNACQVLSVLERSGDLAQRLGQVMDGARAWLATVGGRSPHEVGKAIDALEHDLSALFSFGPKVGRDRFAAELFEVVETARSIAAGAGRLGAGDALDGESKKIASELAEVRAMVHALSDRRGSEEGLDELLATSLLDRDRLAGQLSKRRGAVGEGVSIITVQLVAEALPSGAAAVSYRVVRRMTPAGDGRSLFEQENRLVALVVTGDGEVRLLDLAPSAEVNDLVQATRVSLGVSEVRGAVVPTKPTGIDSRDELRRLVLDPVLAEVGSARRLHVCPDGPLHLVSLAAMPQGEGLVEDHWDIVREVSFERLVKASRESTAPPPGLGVLLVGGVAFDSPASSNASTTEGSSRPESESSVDADPEFPALQETGPEVDALESIYLRVNVDGAQVLRGSEASKVNVLQAVAGKSFVHFATHGFFHPVQAMGREALGVGDVLVGMAPLSRCGLALAGANEGVDDLGRIPGLLTAEELAGADLESCALAVLSACETNLGIQARGRGIASLQAALHAAGVRASLTSLWKVPDQATKVFMEVFWSEVWERSAAPIDALRIARRSLREMGEPPRAWAAWVLTGDPDQPRAR